MNTLFSRQTPGPPTSTSTATGAGAGGATTSTPTPKKMDPEKGPRGGRGTSSSSSSIAKSSWISGMTTILVLTTIIAIVGLVGMAVVGRVLAANIQRLDNRIGANRDTIEGLEGDIGKLGNDIDTLNETMPEGNGTVFFDDEWVMAHGPVPSRQFMFNASLLTTVFPNRRNYKLPDDDGILALLSDIPTIQTEFDADFFALHASGDPTTRVEFDLSMIDQGVTHEYQLPNKNGAVALIEDIMFLLNHDNQSVFLDSLFEIQNDPDTSKSAMFDVSQVFGTKVFGLPNLNGTFVLTEGVQTVSDKTFVADSTWFSSDSGLTAQFDVDALTDARTFSLTDRNQILIGRTGVDWAFESMGWSGIAGTYSYIRVASAFQRDRFMQFAALGSGTGGDIGRAGVDFSWFNGHNYRMYTDDGGALIISYSQSGLPSTNNDLGSPVFRIDPNTGMINFIDRNDGAKRAQFDISGLTTTQTFEFPDNSGVLALLSDIAALGSTFSDALFTIVNDADNSKKAMVDASNISPGTTRVYILPNAAGTFLLEETVIDWNRESARFYLTSDVGIATGGNTLLQAGWSVAFDPNSNQLFGSGNNGLYRVPRNGYYSVTAQLTWEATGGNLRRIEIHRFSGFFSTIVARSNDWPPQDLPFISYATTGIIRASAGQNFKLLVRHAAGETISAIGGRQNTFFAVTYLGPFA